MSFIKKFIIVVLLNITELFNNVNAQIADCGGNFTSLSGTISSPNYPSNYSNSLNCIYNIQASPPNSVNITFIAFETELNWDYLQISCSSDSTKASPKFWGSSLPPFLSIGSCSNVRIEFHTDGSVVFKGFNLSYAIGSGMAGGLTLKPMNNFVLNSSNETIVLGCSSRANQPNVYPWWSFRSSDKPYEIITAPNCSVFPSSSEYRNTTKEYSTRTCNLTISPAYSTSVIGIYTCTDSTLDFANAIVTSIVSSFSSLPDLRSPMTEVVLGDQFSVTCSVQVGQTLYLPLQIKPSLYLYENNRLAATSSTSINVFVDASQELLPSYECDINFTSTGFIPAGYAMNFAQSISFMIPSRLVLYWPENEDMVITGDDNGKVIANGSLSCFVPTNPPATYQWTDEELGHQWEGPNATVSHNGTYTCTATNRIRGITYNASKSVDVTIVDDRPNSISTEKNVHTDQLNIVALIVGVVLGATVLLLLIIVIATCVCLHRKKDSVRATDGDCVNTVVEPRPTERPRDVINLRKLNHRDTMYVNRDEIRTVGARNSVYDNISNRTSDYEYEIT